MVRPRIPLTKAIERAFAPDQVTDWYSTAIQAKTTCTQKSGMKTFPRVSDARWHGQGPRTDGRRSEDCGSRIAAFVPQYLVIQANKFTMTSDYQPKKLGKQWAAAGAEGVRCTALDGRN